LKRTLTAMSAADADVAPDARGFALPGENREASLLGMQLGEQNWLLQLGDVVEVMPPPKLLPVPFTKAWFAGVTCLHGNAVGVVDFAAFLGYAVEQQDNTRLVLLAEHGRCHSALLFSRALGLQACDGFVREPDPVARPAWTAGFYRDGGGQLWSMLDLHGLLSHPDFLHVELPE
jgi:twitching motility protein PilI